jgi:cyclohexanecarboxylate-CoA ligase
LTISLDEALGRVASRSLSAHVARVAGGLRALGVEPGDAVAWQSPNREEIDWCYRACWRLGATAVPLHHLAGDADVTRMLAATTPKVVIEDLDELPDGPAVEAFWSDGDAPAAVLFTSGTSGAPKGVVHTQRSLAFKALQMAEVHELGPDDCVLMPAPCAHISGLLNGITLPGVVPFRVVFMAKWDPAVALGLIASERVTYMVGPPTFFVSMMQQPSFSTDNVASLRLISSGGAGVSEAFVADAQEAFGARVKRTYGSTEAPSVITEGRAIGPVELRVDAHGELLIRGEEVALGYLDAEASAASFSADGWYRSGDLATIAPDGTVAITGRLKDIVIRGGENISTAEVEQVLEAHPAVVHAVVLGEPDELMGERVVAYVETTGAVDLDTVRAWFVEQQVAKFKTPERVVVVDRIPLLPTGKPDKEQLRSFPV